nr:hypothetical protein [Anaerolineaceae bacterium]
TPYGLMRRMKGVQQLINNASSKVHFYMGANRVMYDERAFADPNEVKDEVNKPNFFLPVKADPITGKLYEVNIQTGSSLLEPHIGYLSFLAKSFQDISGVHPASLGSQGAEMSAAATDIARQQDLTGMAKVNDNYRQSRRLVHEMLLSLVIEELSKQRNVTVEVAREIGPPKKVVLNRVLEDGTIENDVSKTNVKVVLESTPKSETYNQQVLIGLTELMKSIADPDVQALLTPGYLRLVDFPGHNRIADLLAQQRGLIDENGEMADPRVKQLQDQVQALTAKLEAKVPPELLEAQVEKTKAETSQILAKVEETIASKIETTIKSIFSAVQTGNLLATNPSISTSADHILGESGFKSPAPTTGVPEAAPTNVMPLPVNKHPNVPASPQAPTAPAPAAPSVGQRMPDSVRGIGKEIEGGQQPKAGQA